MAIHIITKKGIVIHVLFCYIDSIYRSIEYYKWGGYRFWSWMLRQNQTQSTLSVCMPNVKHVEMITVFLLMIRYTTF